MGEIEIPANGSTINLWPFAMTSALKAVESCGHLRREAS
jgi:hypothetical protein